MHKTSSNVSTPPNLHAPVERDGKALTPVSNEEFYLTILIGLPVWLTVVLPLTAIYQVGSILVGLVSPTDTKTLPSLESGYKVSRRDVILRPDRTYDVVLLGATGFTGKLAALHLAKTYGTNKDVKWAIAGRSEDKMQKIKESLAAELKDSDILNVPTIVVDTSVPSTIPGLVRDTRVVISTVGPFRKYGNHVVEFAAKFGTHYADITGETDWGQTMMNTWQSVAKASGAKLIHFCGCDSVPWDMSVYQLAETLKKEKNEDLSRVSCVNEINSEASGGTLETMKLAMKGNDLPTLGDTKPFQNTASGALHNNPFAAKLPYFWFTELSLPWIDDSKSKPVGSLFIMSMVNAKVVNWTQALRKGASLTYTEYALDPDNKTAFCRYFGLVAFFTALLNPITSYLLFKFVLPSPGEGPTMKKMTTESFASIYSEGVGTEGTKVESLMYFPACVGYLETARMLVESGLSMALSEEELPSDGGGFFSPAFGLGNVLLHRLTKTGTYFSVRCKDSSESTYLQRD